MPRRPQAPRKLTPRRPPALNAAGEYARRGNNAYYYAHGHRNDAPAWDGDPSPMKPRRRALPEATAGHALQLARRGHEDPIYIPVDDERFQRPDAITLTWTEKSVVLAAHLATRSTRSGSRCRHHRARRAG